MISRLILAFRNISSKRTTSRLRRLEIIGQGSVCLPGFSINSQGTLGERLRIGESCLLQSKFVFESRDGGSISVGNRCHIGGNTMIISRSKINIGDDVTIAWNCTVYDHDSHSLDWELRKNDTPQELRDLADYGDPLTRKDWSRVKTRPISIRDRVWLGFGVTVLKGVTIGEGSVVGAMSVVTKDIPPYSVVAGNPAQIIRQLDPPEGVR